MAYQYDFGLTYVSQWRDGDMPMIKNGTVVVSYDTRNMAYAIDEEELPLFKKWVAENWGSERDLWEDDESADDYLERIGARIWWPHD